MNEQPAQTESFKQVLSVSVVIITYNGLRFMQACLDSVLDQDFPREAYEILVLDNASRDGTADFIEQNYPDIRLIRLDQNYGPCDAINRALDYICGTYLAYLNQDIVAHRQWLSELINVIKTHPQAGIVESNMILPQWPEYKGLRRDEMIENAYVCDITSWMTHDFRIIPVTETTPPVPLLAAYGAGCIINPAIVEQIGYLIDPDFFAYADDLDLGLRLNAAGYQVLLAPRSVVFHDTDWHFKWDKRSLRRALWVTRNTILAFYKISYPQEFMLLLPRLLVGKMLKAGQHQSSYLAKTVYALAALPLLIVAMFSALVRLPRYRHLRAETMSRRKMPPGWLTERILKPDWKPNPVVWTNKTRVA
jgi:GT2 family glycosyltransferase